MSYFGVEAVVSEAALVIAAGGNSKLGTLVKTG